MTGKQLLLDLGHRPALGRNDFLVAPSNAVAVAQIDRWPNWLAPSLLLVGPKGSGKSHLASVFEARTGATRRPLSTLTTETIPELMAGFAVILEHEDGTSVPEHALFHLLNYARQEKGHVLLTSTLPASGWGLVLPDLISRLRATPTALIEAPDDALLRGVLVKHFNDRQIAVDEALISYILNRMPRDMATAQEIVAIIDREALEARAEISRPFVAKVMKRFETTEMF